LLDDDKGDPSAVTRDYLLESRTDGPPLITVWGGKVTTFRKLSEEAADMVCGMLGSSAAAWTAPAQLPGGNLSSWGGDTGRPDRDFHTFAQTVRHRYPWLPRLLALRLARAYGSRIDRILGDATSLEGLGTEVAPDLYEAELEYLIQAEWATEAEDVLWRRSRLGLHCSPAQRDSVAAWFRARVSPADQSPAEVVARNGRGKPQASSSLL
jgi:glycerol-3-phosphate dehydrogenase